jgi:hypothetical protein
MPGLLRLLVASLGLLAVVALAACGGDGDGEAVAEPKTEAQTVKVGGLRYRAVLFRQVNPQSRTDGRLFDEPVNGRDGLWFGAYITICNESRTAQTSPEGFRLVDAFGRTFSPREEVADDTLAYEPTRLEPGECLPQPGGFADRVTGGAVLLFQIPRGTLQDRPLFLRLPPSTAPRGGRPPRIALDV